MPLPLFLLTCTISAEPAAWLRFDEAGRNEGRFGGGLRLDGTGGLTIAEPPISAEGGFAVDFWAKFDEVGDNYSLAGCDGEWFIRLDPPNEGNQISLFVNVNGAVEPRVRGLAPQPGQWYHVTAGWDGSLAVLWINGRRFTQQRIGAVAPSGRPVVFGAAQQWAPRGLRGTLDEVKVYATALTDGEQLESQFGLGDGGVGPRRTDAEFEFAADEGWQSRPGASLSVAGGRLTTRLDEPGAGLVRLGLAVPLAERRYVCLRLAAQGCRRIQVPFLTTTGGGMLEFDVLGPGHHSYILDGLEQPAWSGELTALGLTADQDGAELEVDFVRVTAEPRAPAELTVASVLPEPVIPRAGRPVPIIAQITNRGGPAAGVRCSLTARGATVAAPADVSIATLPHGETAAARWTITAAEPGELELTVTVAGEGFDDRQVTARVPIAPAIEVVRADYVPAPEPPDKDILVGCHYCPLWKQGSRAGVWELIEPFPARKPALGFYDEDNPEVTDWEIKWALDHGIDFFIYCWYRANQQAPVEQNLGHAIHDGLFHSRYGDRFRWCIMWENQSRGRAGVASEADFLETLLPYWIETYFKRPDYLKIDGKPMLYIYRPEFLVDDLGGVEQVRSALDKAREICRQAGFEGLWLLGEYRGVDPRPLRLMADLGLDAAFQYCWPVGGDPDDGEAIATQEQFWRQWREMDILPYQITASMGWDSTPWHPSFSRWHLTPDGFRDLCERARAEAMSLPEGSLGRRMVLLDNWNEFGEGHYIFPHREYGFGYLDAVRQAFAPDAGPHLDLVPEDLGLGPYGSRYDAWKAEMAAARRVVTAPGGDAPGLVAWWSFDEEDDAGYAFDYTGGGTGGMVQNAARAAGRVGRALVCAGGSVTVPREAFELPTGALTVEAWIHTDTPEQTDRWFANCIYGDGASGFRFGVSGGKLCFAAPLTAWSHHFTAPEPLPTGRWVHVAGVADGAELRLYQDGARVATLARRGRLRAPNGPLTLGNFAVGHRAHFQGLLDEVKLWRRALTDEEIAAHAR